MFEGPRQGAAGRLIWRNISLLLVGQAAALAANFGFIAVTARLFTKEEIAVLAVAGVLTAVMDVCKGFGYGTLLLKGLPALGTSRDARAAGLVGTFLVYSFVPPLGLTIIAVAASGPLSWYFFHTPDHQAELALGLAGGLFGVMVNSHLLVLQAGRRFGALAGMTILSTLLQKALPCAAAAGEGFGLERFLWWCALCSGAAAAATLAVVVRPLAGVERPRVERFDAVWNQSRQFYYTSLLQFGATQMDQVVAAGLLAPPALAVYYMVRRLYSLAVVIIRTLADVLTPDLAGQAGTDHRAARRRLGEWQATAEYGVMLGAALLAVNGQAAIEILLGPGYGDDPVLLLGFAVSVIAYTIYSFTQIDLILFRDPGLSLRAAAVTAGANVLGAALLSRLVGAGGLAIAMALSYLGGTLAARGWSGGAGAAPVQLRAATAMVLAPGLMNVALAWMGAGWMSVAAANLLVGVMACVKYRSWGIGERWRKLA